MSVTVPNRQAIRLRGGALAAPDGPLRLTQCADGQAGNPMLLQGSLALVCVCLAPAGKLRTVWSAVGRMAGFMQQNERLALQESLQSQGGPPSPPLMVHSTLSTASGDGNGLGHQQLRLLQLEAQRITSESGGVGAAGGAGVGQLGAPSGVYSAAVAPPARSSGGVVYQHQQSRNGRVRRGSGAGAPASLPGISMQNAYPKI